MSRYSDRERDFERMGWIKRQPCAAAEWGREAGVDMGPCSGAIEADHAGRRGLGQKADDDTCIPLCTGHHRARTDFSGPFKTWRQEGMREWLAAMVERYRARWNTRGTGLIF